jgi:hypothetical protein
MKEVRDMQKVFEMAAATVFLSVFLVVGMARAQTTEPTTAPDEPMEANGVGISGGIFAGAEVVLIPMAIIDRHHPIRAIWPWIVFPTIGAAGGGVGGYYLEQASPEGAVALLVVSMAAIIPTAVAVASAQAYDPAAEGAIEANSASRFQGTGDGTEEDATEVESRPEGIPDSGAPPPAPPVAPVPQSKSDETPPQLDHLASGALFHMNAQGGFGLGVPALDVRPVTVSRFDPFITRDLGTAFMVSLLKIDIP